MEQVLSLLEGSPHGVYAVNFDQQIVLWNGEAERILGWKAEDVLGQSCSTLIATRSSPPSGEEAVCQANCLPIQLARRAIVAPPQRIQMRDAKGSSHWLQIIHLLIPGSRQELGTLVHLFLDVTQEQEARDLVGRLNAAIWEAGPQLSDQETEDGHGVEPLTAREQDVLRLLARGEGTEEIAGILALSPVTVRNYVQRILAKLGVHSRLEAVALAFRQGLL